MSQFSTLVNLHRQYFESGEPSSLKARKNALLTLRKILTEEGTKITEAVQKDLRRQPGTTHALEVANSIVEIDYFLENLKEWSSPTYVEKTLTTALDTPMIQKKAKGVVLIIGPWNYPVSMITLPLIAVLGAGNTAIIKPSEMAPHTAQVFDELFTKYYEKRFIAVIQGGVSETTELLKERFDHIMYTGCTPVGKIIMAAAAKHLTPVTLELGGKCPVIVESDADITISTKRIAWGKWLNCGQTCLAPDYILTTPQLKSKVIAGLTAAIKEFYGENIQKSKDYSRIINQRHFDRINTLLEKTKAKMIFQGGEPDRDDLFIPPVLLDVEHGDIVMEDEIFGPILPIVTIRDLDDAISVIRTGERPLAAYLFTRDEKKVSKFLDDTTSGGVTINDVLMHITVDTLPFGGVGHSGMGRYRGKFGFDTFTHERAVLKRGFFGEQLAAARYPPSTPAKEKNMKQLTGTRRPVPKLVKNYLPTIPYLLMGILLGFLLNKYSTTSSSDWVDSIKMGYSKVPVDGKVNFRRYQRKLDRIEKNIQNKLFPIKLEWLLWTLIGIGLLNTVGFAPMNTTIDNLTDTLEYHLGSTIWNRLISVTVVGTIFITVSVFLIRLAFTLMNYYHGWLFEEIGKPVSLSTKMFMVVVQFVNKYTTFFSFTELLPWQPVPSLNSTIERYLRTVKPLVDEARYEEIVQMSEEFKKNEGPSLQRKVWLKWMTSRNYVSDWWKEVVYMRYRNSLINTNVGCADVIYQKTTENQAARTAAIILMRLNFLREVFQKQSFKPITLGGIPLCPNQYLDYHRTIRLPRETSDEFVRLPDSKFIAVYCKGCWYKINIFHNRRLLRAAELEKALQGIIDRTPDPVEKEPFLGALTAGPRDLWARVRKEKFGSGVNAESLSVIEGALEIIYLDEEEHCYDENDPSKYNAQYARALHGYGYKLWCDKPSVYMFSKNGQFMSNAEHSCVDAMVLVHIREYIKYHEHFSNPYLPDGHCRGEIECVPTAERLKFELDGETKDAIDEAYKFSKSIADDFENASIIFTEYGKDFIKKAKVSPDAYIQTALQMAYKKDQGSFGLTYEPAVMRLFKDGRTETVRSCSIESCEFVNAVGNPEIPDKEKLALLRNSCDKHQEYYRNCMAGKGCDRHLFALYVVSKYLQIKSPFLDSVFNMPFALSTSQTPQHQMPEYSKALNKEKDLFWPAGGFCCPEGSNYGVCYTISAPGDCLSFHVSSWKSIQNTDASRFLGVIVESLRELHDLVERVES